MSTTVGSSPPLRVVYRLRLAAGVDPEARARELAIEQSAELPEECIPAAAAGAIGRVEEVEAGGDPPAARAVIAYPLALLDRGLGQLVNLLFGNVSLQAGVRVEEVAWPETVLGCFAGPGLGIRGIRELGGADSGRPLVATALKPVGLPAAELARRCREFALGGIDVVKDDHSLADQAAAPFGERVARCQEAVEEAARETGRRTLYAPHLAAGPGFGERVERARQVGCRVALVAPWILGLDAVRGLARRTGVALLGHPALTGAYFAPGHGIAPAVLLGELFRLAGCDGVVFPNAGGRFPFRQEDCDATVAALRRPLGGLRPALPVPGGGIAADRARAWAQRYGPDTMLLLGSGLYAGGDLRRAAAAVMREVRGEL